MDAKKTDRIVCSTLETGFVSAVVQMGGVLGEGPVDGGEVVGS